MIDETVCYEDCRLFFIIVFVIILETSRNMLQSTLVISNSHGINKTFRHSECSSYQVFEITDANDVKVRHSESFEIEKKNKIDSHSAHAINNPERFFSN